MSTDVIPANVRALLDKHITSFEGLELVLLLRRAPPEKWWSAAEASEHVRIPVDLAMSELEGLVSSGLVARSEAAAKPLYQYAPATDELEQAVDELERVFQEQRPALLSLMSANAIERVRSAAATAFSDAFLLKKHEQKK